MYNITPYTPIDLSVMNANNTFPTDGDVLCGRGSTCYKHVGNQNFRFIIAVHLPKYTDPLTTRKEKGIMIQKIVNDLLNEGRRFLKEGITGWEVLCHKEAKYKVGHALRDAASEMKKYLKKHSDAKKTKRSRSKENTSDSTAAKTKTDSGDNAVETIEKVESDSNALKIEIEQKDAAEQSQLSTALSEKNIDGYRNDDNLISSLSHLFPDNACNTDDEFDTLYDNISPALFDDTDLSLLSDEGMLFDDLLLT